MFQILNITAVKTEFEGTYMLKIDLLELNIGILKIMSILVGVIVQNSFCLDRRSRIDNKLCIIVGRHFWSIGDMETRRRKSGKLRNRYHPFIFGKKNPQRISNFFSGGNGSPVGQTYLNRKLIALCYRHHPEFYIGDHHDRQEY